MSSNIPSIQNIGDIDLSAARSKVNSGVAGVCISIFSNAKEINAQLDKAENAGKKAKGKIQDANKGLDGARGKVKDAEGKQRNQMQNKKKVKLKIII